MFKQGTAYPSGTHEFTAGFYWGLCCSIFNFLCRCLSYWPLSFCHCVVCLLWFTGSDYSLVSSNSSC